MGPSAVAASPPVPGKKGPQAPRYGRTSATAAGQTPPTFRTLQSRAPLLGAASYNVLAIRVAFTDTPIDSSSAYYDRLVFMVRDMVAAADSTVDFRSYQGIVIFHGGQGQEADVLDNSRAQIWSA